MGIASINPATGETIKTYDAMTPEAAAAAVVQAHKTWQAWRTTPFGARARPMKKTAEILRERKNELAKLMATEMGKPLKQGAAEVEKCALGCDYYADNAEAHLAPETIKTENSKSYVAFEPLGVVLAVMPWNFPLWQVYRFAAPALMAGNVGVLKHASNVPGCALVIEEIFTQAGFPEGAFRTLLIGNKQVQAVIEHPLVRAVTLTGSTAAGKIVAAQAAAALKKTVLELGGSDPYLVLEDADLDHAVQTCVNSRLINSGQSCIAAKRFIVHRAIADRFLAGFSAGMQALRMGDPLDPRTQLGPLASARLAEELEAQVEESVALGARLVCGGGRAAPDSAYFLPTVLTDIPRESPAYRDELFGPVGCVFVAADIDDAIRIANDTRFGLGSSAWTNDSSEQERFVRELDAGSVFVNDMVVSDARFPFGGVKASGYGRELSDVGLREFVNVKTVRIRVGDGGASHGGNTE